MNEEWRPVVGWEGMYEVSDQGNVRSLPRTLSKPGWGTFTRQGRALRPDEAKGYYRVTMQSRANGRLERNLIHRIVLEAFVGPAEPGQETRHLDGDKHNNRPGNLAWGTRVENASDRDNHGNMRRSLNRGQCAHGHSWDEGNLKLDPKGRAYCMECRRRHAAKYRKQKASK